MTKQDIINVTAERNGFTKNEVEIMLDELCQTIREALIEGNDVQIRQFGTFSAKAFNERQGRNPGTGESITIPARKRVRFKASKTFENSMN